MAPKVNRASRGVADVGGSTMGRQRLLKEYKSMQADLAKQGEQLQVGGASASSSSRSSSSKKKSSAAAPPSLPVDPNGIDAHPTPDNVFVWNYSSPACGARTSRSFDLVYWRGRVQGAPVPQLLFSAQQPHHQLSTLLCGYAGGRTIFIGTALAQKSKVRFFSSFFPERPQYYTEPPSDKPPLPQHKVQKIVVRYENTPKYERYLSRQKLF
ncbi:unnamed protein product [Amoebophrya sp. A25]|nr:unnamed protein product [Amoebophrya sp. A25]|eukprot:GSA25T00023037001.1